MQQEDHYCSAVSILYVLSLSGDTEDRLALFRLVTIERDESMFPL